MSSAKFTLWGCEQYFNDLNISLFDNLVVPEGINKETLTDNIMMRGGEFEVQYGSPVFMRTAIGAWSSKWQPTMKRWADALAIEYNPLENYDRMEDWNDKTERSDATSQTSDLSRNMSRSEETSHADSENYSESKDNTSNESYSEARDRIEDETTGSQHSSTDTTNATESTNDRTIDTGSFTQQDTKQITSSTTSITDRDKYNNSPKHTVTKSAYDSNGYEPQMQETDTGKWEESTSGSSTETLGSTSTSEAGSTKTGSLTSGKTETLSESSSGSRDVSASESAASDKTGVYGENVSSAKNGSSAGALNASEDNTEHSAAGSSSAMNNDFVHTGRIHGNIGVTTSQQMLLAELELGYWNVYEKITELFLQEFTIPVYI